jgi:Tfp pilus assembly protein FimT
LKINSNLLNKKQSGISLIELAVTMLLISVLSTIGFNTFDSSIKAENVISASEQVAFAIKKAKYYARSKGVVTKLSFPVGGSSYSITVNGETVSNNSNFDATSGVLPKNVKILQNTCNSINFYVDGSLITDSGLVKKTDCILQLGYTDGQSKTLTIKGNTGNVL